MGVHLWCFKLIARTNKRAVTSRARQNKAPRVRGNSNPPQITSTIMVKNHRFRFVSNAGAYTGTVTFDDLADLMCVATTATTAVRQWAALKLKQVEIWAGNSAGNASNTVQMEWVDTVNIGGSDIVITDTAIGLMDIAHIKSSPPGGSKAADWLNNSSGSSGSDFTILNINLPQGAIIDITLDVNFYDTDSAVSVTGAVAGATTGKTYCRALDSASGTALLPPISFDTI